MRAQATDPSLSLRIVGDGPDSERLRAMAGKGVEFMGRVSHEQVLEHLRNARAVVVPSEWQEVFGAALLEAMALGKPVIASRVAGPQEIVEEGVTGLLFDPGNANSLASCMKRLQNDATLAAWLGKAGRERYWREYSPDAGYKRLLSIFERLQVEDKLA